MKLILVVLLNFMHLIQFIKCRSFHAIANDELLDYSLDTRVKSFRGVMNDENLILEQIDEDNMKIGGYITFRKSYDRKIPFNVEIKTQSLEQSIWKDQPMKLSLADGCKEFINLDRFFYNITRLWTDDVCPPTEGDKWIIEPQNCNMLIDLPDNTKDGPWKAFILASQNTHNGKAQFGLGIGAEIVRT